MVIAGGCYRETCEKPQWSGLFGSGGRAATAVARLASSVELHTYRPSGSLSDLYPTEALGVRIYAVESATEIAFAYFHPLSNPVIEPRPHEIVGERSLRVEGATVLRFGLVEGDAVVVADRAIYDPQSARGAPAFSANGSRANELAVVLNENELRATAGASGADAAAQQLLVRDGAAVVIAKGGIRGAQVYAADGTRTWIPPYESRGVFKIGSGDVFSAAFAYYWGEARLDAVEAADLASRSVAFYCGSRVLPLPDAAQIANLTPLGSSTLRPVYLAGSVATLGSRWVMEEARWCLKVLGVDVVTPALRESTTEVAHRAAHREAWGAMLVIGDFMDRETRDVSTSAAERNRAVVVLSETGEVASELADRPNVKVTDDFATAIYLAGWSAAI